jgi:hypothetical protein
MLTAIANLRTGYHDEAKRLIDEVFVTMLPRVKVLLTRDNSMVYDTLVTAMQLAELQEIRHDSGIPIRVWNERLSLCRKDFKTYCAILEVSIPFLNEEQQVPAILSLLKRALKEGRFPAFKSIFGDAFSDVIPTEATLLLARSRYKQGDKDGALETLSQIDIAGVHPKLASRIAFFRGLWFDPQFLRESVRFDPTFYKAWHHLADLYAARYEGNAMEAIQSLLKCISLREEHAFVDLVMLIEILFKAELSPADFEKVSEQLPDTLLVKAIRILLAGLCDDRSRAFVTKLVGRMMPGHFDAILWPLLMMECRESQERLNEFRNSFPRQCSDAISVRLGLLRAGTSSLERWVACARSIGEEDPRAVISVELAWQNGLLDDYREKVEKLLNNFDGDRLARLVGQWKSLLHQFRPVSTEDLAFLKDLSVAVPGCRTGIASFTKRFDVKKSKRYPRMVQMTGANGNIYYFVLKGTGDVRLYQRVMDLFNLVNIQIQRNLTKDFRNCRLRIYSVTPLSDVCGLIEYLAGCDTLSDLIGKYRTQRVIDDQFEQKFASDMTIEKTDRLERNQKLEILLEIESTTKEREFDLANAIASSSPSSIDWLKRITRFAQSTALISTTGFWMGIGNRHPRNVMIDRQTGDVLHVDFVARQESVPLRMTRMIRRAFGPCKLEGDFKIVSEALLCMLRATRHSVAAVLDDDLAFGRIEEEGQMKIVIEIATEPYNLAAMGHHWVPFW